MTNQIYKCNVCESIFEAPLDYDDDPKTRTCIHGCDAAGNIQYLGYMGGRLQIIRDDLGFQGVVNPVDGQKYDSKSQYYKAVKASGMEVIGTDAKAEKRTKTLGDFDCRRDIAQAIEQTGAMEKLKRERR